MNITAPRSTPEPGPADVPLAAPRGFWGEVWRRFRKRKLAMAALMFVGMLSLVAVFSPAIVGVKPIVCRYKGHYYFPCLGYFDASWEENGVFLKDRIQKRYSTRLKKKDPESWAIWPLVYQDPYRQIDEDEWPGQPANPMHDQGSPNRYNWFGVTQQGVDVFAQMVHGTTIALSVGFVSMGIATLIGVVLGSLAGYFRGWVDIAISRLIEVVMCVPQLVLILALIAVIPKQKTWHIMVVLGLTNWTGIARLIRGEFLRLREMEFVTAARALGAGGRGSSFAISCPMVSRRCWCRFRLASPAPF